MTLEVTLHAAIMHGETKLSGKPVVGSVGVSWANLCQHSIVRIKLYKYYNLIAISLLHCQPQKRPDFSTSRKSGAQPTNQVAKPHYVRGGEEVESYQLPSAFLPQKGIALEHE